MKKGVSIVIATLALLAFWELASLALDKAFLPGPLTSFKAFVALCADGEMWPQFGISALRVLVSTALGVLPGCAAGAGLRALGEALSHRDAAGGDPLSAAEGRFSADPGRALRSRQSAKDRAHHAHHFLPDLRGRL